MKKVAASSNGTRTGDGWQAEKSAMTRKAILEAAVRCLVKEGYNKTTTAMIASEAGVSRGAMMHHFSARAEVIKVVIAFLHERRLDEYRQLMGEKNIAKKSPGLMFGAQLKLPGNTIIYRRLLLIRSSYLRLEPMTSLVRLSKSSKRTLRSNFY